MSLPKEYDKYLSNLNLTQIAKDLLQKRYFLRNAEGEITEDAPKMFYRIASNIAIGNSFYGEDVKETEEQFFKALISQEIIPATPILMNAGGRLQFLFSDHALNVSDSLESIFETLKIAAGIQQNGGGVGFNFSKVRPRFDAVSGIKNVAFGPLSVMNIFDTSFSAILQGGKRPGANMGVLDISHPDILSFIHAKKDITQLNNFNLSIAITDEFMDAVINQKPFNLINPRNEEIVKTLDANELFDAIVEFAWCTGDPGLIFIDEMNRKYPFDNQKITCTGCCGQYELEEFEGVPYAHINLTKIINKNQLDLDKLKELVEIAVHFLDNCIEMHRYSDKRIEDKVKSVRKIGLGIMGFADLLFKLKIEYGSDESLDIIETIMKVFKKSARKASRQLAFRRGTFPKFGQSNITEPTRNATITSISPTGSTSMIAGVSQSIEPVYALTYTAKTSDGQELTLINAEFRNAIENLGLNANQKVQLNFVDSIGNIDWLNQKTKNVFKTSHDVSPEDHLRVMAKFQRYIDNSISKTINLPNKATREEVKEIFIKAFKRKCKGITVYRDGCREDQVFMNKRQTKLYAFE